MLFFTRRKTPYEPARAANPLSCESLESRHMMAGVVADGVPQVEFEVVNDWGSGYQGLVSVTNDEAVKVNNWTLAFDLPQNITQLWNGNVVNSSANPDGSTHYVVQAMSWNAQLDPGQTVTFGFLAGPGGVTEGATDFVINGVELGEGPVDPPPPVVPGISLGDVSITEGDSGQKLATLTVSLSQATTVDVSVNFATANGTAQAGSDYTAQSGTLTIAAGQTQGQFTIAVLGDTADEANETFTVPLSQPQNGTLADGTATVTIVDNDDAPPPVPAITVGDAIVTEGDELTISGGGWFHTEGNQIVDADGNTVQLTGVNWFGFETETASPHGLWARNWEDMMEQMADLGFNTIRMPFSLQNMQPGQMPQSINYALNPDLQGLTSLQVLDKLVEKAGELEMRILLDCHRAEQGGGPNPSGLWYTSQYSEQAWIDTWVMLAQRYADNPVVIGADLQNEPHSGTWGTGDLATDWRLAAERAGNAILAVNPNWLIFVEGIGTTPEAGSYWWGGNLSRAGDYPVRLDVADRLVYSAHAYPQSVYDQPWFHTPDFPNNLPAIWDTMFGYLYKEDIAPVFIGEWGASFDPPLDEPWVDTMVQYLDGDFNIDGSSDIPASDKGISWTWWSWNPNSSDTEGILNDDWTTVDFQKFDKIQNSLAAPLPVGQSGGGTQADLTTVTLIVSLSQATTVPVTVSYTTEGVTATSGVDFLATAGVLTFSPGETQKLVSMTVRGDTLLEVDETFRLVLSGANNATLADSVGVVTILDDDIDTPPPPPVPSVNIGDITVTEGDSGTTATTVTVSLSGAASETVSVNWATANGTATAGSDYTAASGVLHFAPGETEKTITIPVRGDTADEADERFTVELLGVVAAELARSRATVTILDDDTVVTPPVSGVSGEFLLNDDWGSGFVAQVRLVNNGTQPIDGWTLTFEFDREIINIWNAEIVSHVGNTYTIRAASWNRTIPPGGSVTFGFQGLAGNVSQSPTDVALNGLPLTLDFES